MKFSLLVATVVLSHGLLFALRPEFADMVVTNYVPSNAAGDAPEAIACDYVCDPTEPVATRPLVFRTQSQSQALPTILYYTHDGNKNVSELVTPNATVAAHYEYAPFGAVTVSSGMYALDNPFCFSSEYADNTLDLVYYHMPGKDRKTVTGKHGGHGFITRLTAAGWLGDHWYSEAIDFLNPFSDLSDLIELVDESAEISERDDEDANWQERECVPCN